MRGRDRRGESHERRHSSTRRSIVVRLMPFLCAGACAVRPEDAMTTKGRGKRWQHLKKLAQAKAPARVQGMCAFGMVMRGSWRDSARRCVSAAAQPPERGPGRARPWAVLEVSPPPAGTAGQGPPRAPQPEAEPEPEAEPDGTVVSRDTHHTFVSRASGITRLCRVCRRRWRCCCGVPAPCRCTCWRYHQSW